MASPSQLGELRLKYGTTFNGDTYVAPDAAGWDPSPGTVDKIRVVGQVDAAGLVIDAVPDTTLQQRPMAKPAPIPVKQSGDYKFSTYLGAAESDNSVNPIALLLSKSMGGISSPVKADRTYAVSDAGGTSTTTKIYAADIDDEAVGNAVLINGEVRSIISTGTDGAGSEYANLNMALASVPTDATSIVVSTTVYIDWTATQSYVDALILGAATGDNYQANSAVATALELAGAGIGELPMITHTMTPAAHKLATANLETLSPTSAEQGNDPPVNFGKGGLFFGDFGVTTRTAYDFGNLAMPSLGPAYVPIRSDLNGINGQSGWQKVGQQISATFSLLFESDTGLEADFLNKTAKQLIAQFGTAVQKCVAIELQRCFQNARPKRGDLDGLRAMDVSLQADEGTTTTNELTYSAIRIHFF